MNVLDIVLIVILIWAAVSGYRQGIIAQACGLAGIIAGVWLAFRFSSKLAGWLGTELSDIAAFAILFVVAVLVMILFGRLAKSILKLTGLGFIDRMGGLLLSVAEYALIAGLLLGLFANINSRTRWIETEKIEESMLYKPIVGFSDMVFPYILGAKDTILDGLRKDDTDAPETGDTQNTQNT